ncbi:cation:proton antiporter [Oligoflexia bacterium]|nr:cation:proton antiporter [Oligoflexia bacterium]
MREELMISIAAILFLGVAAQWLAWRFRFPSILLLLVLGFIAGPVTGLLKPDEVFGDLLSPLVSLSVGLILFEGGLSLRLAEVPGVRRAIFSLISVGLLVTWVIGAAAAHYVLGLDLGLALLLGAILTVSGPTVIIPLLRVVRLRAPLGSILKWEGILIDPVGALLAVLVFEVLVEERLHHATIYIATGVFKTVLIGGALGLVAAWALIFVIRRHLLPDYLRNPVSLVLVLTVFVISNHFSHESGLLAATVMGIALANSKHISVRHIVEFEENLRVLLIAVLFIVLSARLELSQLMQCGFSGLLFLAVMIFIARPASVLLATVGSGLTWRQRFFLSALAPRGIVAAAVASLFALELASKDFPGAHLLVPYTFIVIIGAGFFYSLVAKPVARLLKVEQRDPQGILFLGANAAARAVASEIWEEGFRVALVDTNWHNASLAKLEGTPTVFGDILSRHMLEKVDLDGIGRLFAMTPNDEANSLAALRFSTFFDRSEVYQLPPENYDVEKGTEKDRPEHLRGRLLFGPQENYYKLAEHIDSGAIVKTTHITEAFPYSKLMEMYKELFIPLFILTAEKQIEVFTTDIELIPKSGDKVVALVKEHAK